MLIQTPVQLSQPDLIALNDFLQHKGRSILEKVIKGQIAAYANKAHAEMLTTPLNVLAAGPENSKARANNIAAAKYQIFLDVLQELSKPEHEFEMTKFEVE